jgi:type IV secretion system protein VirB10
MMDDHDFDETLPGEPLPGDFDPGEPEEAPIDPLPDGESIDYGDPFPDDFEAEAADMDGLDMADMTGPDSDGIADAFGDVFGNEPETGEFDGPEESDSGEPYPEDSSPEPADHAEAPFGEGDSGMAQDQIPVEPFVPEKSSASQILGAPGPHKLNNQLILAIGVGAFALIFILATFVRPMFNRKKAEKITRPRPTAVSPSDYSALVPRKTLGPAAVEEDEETLDEIIADLPPVDPRYRYEEPPPVISAGTASAASDRPDTRDDRLQGKSISGIKGITPTQRNYLSGTGAGPYQDYQQSAAADPNNPYAQFGMPSKADYAQQMLSMYQGAGADAYTRQNDQSGKMQFYNQGRENAGNGSFLGYNSIWQGTIFEATLTSNINTDLPGEATAWVTKNIYSSLDGRYLLIPQNSRLFGTYNSSISYSQSRIQVGWHTLIRPDGYMVNLGAMQATDSRGAAGLKGLINDHPFQYLKALALLSAFNILNVEFSTNAANTQNQYVQNVMANSQEIANTLGSKLIDRALDVQPTITIKAGTKINIVANQNLTLPPLPPYEVTMPYHRGE